MNIQRSVAFVIAGRWWLAALAAAIFVVAWGPSRSLSFDRRIEQMFPASDPSVESYELLRRRFGGNAVAMVVYRDDQLLTEEGLRRVEGLAERAVALPGVQGVLTLAQVNAALEQTQPARLLGISGAPPILGDDAIARGFRELFAGYTHDAEGTYAAIVAMLDPAQPAAHEKAIEGLRALADPLPPEHHPVALVGEPVLVAEGFTLVEEDGRRLSTTTLWLLGLATLVMFRSPRWVIAELVLIAWAVVTTRAAAMVLGMRLSMVSSMLTAIVTVIAVGCVIHVAVQYGVRRRRGDDPRKAAETTFVRMFPPILWACLTDAAGFAALVVSEVGPVRDFGLMMTLGSGMVLLGVVLILPAMVLLPPHRFRTPTIPADRWIRRRMVRMLGSLNRHRRAVGVVTLVVAVLTGVGLTRLRTETNFIRNFRASSDLARSYAMVESELGGAGVWDVILPAPATLSDAYLDRVRALEADLMRIRVVSADAGQSADGARQAADKERSDVRDEVTRGRLTKVLSIADAEEIAARNPLLAIATPTVRIAGMRSAMPTFADALLTPPRENDSGDPPQQRYLRIMLRSPENMPAESKMALIRAVEEVVGHHTSTDQWRRLVAGDAEPAPAPGYVTGYYVLLARLIESLLSDQWLCLALAAAGVFAMMIGAFRSFRLAAVCMIPNLLPVLAVLGALGISGREVNMGAAMIAAVSIGLTVDGSIHFLTQCLAAHRRGASPLRSVLHAQRRVGLPVVLATVALAMGFSVLASSAFVPTVTFGLLVTAALVAGTLTNLTLLPLMLVETLRHRDENVGAGGSGGSREDVAAGGDRRRADRDGVWAGRSV